MDPANTGKQIDISKTTTVVNKLDNTKGDNTKLDNTKGDNTKGDNTKGDNTKSDNTKGDNTKGDNTKSDNTKGDNTKGDNVTNTDRDKPKYTKPVRNNGAIPDRIKYSMGIACCRINDKTHRAELLMVCKRNTYNFVQFVHGSYDPNDSNSVLKLLNGMTRDEKLDILSGNFQQIWYRIWLNTPVNSAYFPARNKYTVLWNETGSKLRALIDRSSNSRLIWELPKGRKKTFSESDLSCAIREFNEETGLSRGSYQLLNLPSKKWVVIDNNTKYISRYFLAGYRGSGQYTHPVVYDTSEISEVRWMDIEQIKIHEPGMYNFAKNLLKIYKKYTKPYIKSKFSIYNQLTSDAKAI